MTITFKADDGTELHGVLRAAAPGAPAVALTGPFTGVKDQVTGTYAERLFAAGLTTLAFDHRGWGQSGGRRCHEDPQGKLADLRAAVSVLTEHSDNIGVVGICMGGGYAVRAAAADLLTATPLLVVHGTKDDYCTPDLARMLHERAQGPKEIAWVDTTNHIDLYDTEPFVTQAADLAAAFLKKFLSP